MRSCSAMSQPFLVAKSTAGLAGVLLARQVDKGQTRSKRNDRIIAIAQASLLFAEVNELADLPSVVMQQVEEFFVNYQKVREVE